MSSIQESKCLNAKIIASVAKIEEFSLRNENSGRFSIAEKSKFFLRGRRFRTSEAIDFSSGKDDFGFRRPSIFPPWKTILRTISPRENDLGKRFPGWNRVKFSPREIDFQGPKPSEFSPWEIDSERQKPSAKFPLGRLIRKGKVSPGEIDFPAGKRLPWGETA